jgi:tetratricopeptide (TPR) repeat protein
MKSTPALVGILLAICLAMVAGVFLFRSMHALDPLADTASGTVSTGSGMHPELYSRTFEPTYEKSRLQEFDKELLDLLALEKQPGSVSREELIDRAISKARLYDALGQTGKAIETLEKVFENNFDKNGQLNNAMATYYEKVGTYQLALDRYDFLVRELGDFTFLQRVARIWQDRGDNRRAKKAMDAYERMRAEYERQQSASGAAMSGATVSGVKTDNASGSTAE